MPATATTPRSLTPMPRGALAAGALLLLLAACEVRQESAPASVGSATMTGMGATTGMGAAPAMRAPAAAAMAAPSGPLGTVRAPMPTAQPAAADRFAPAAANPVVAVQEQPVSTFSLDVDTASYAISRRFIAGGQRPPVQAVRVEQFVNYFPYDYPRPGDRDQPFAVTTTVMPSPWNAHNQLLHIGLKAYEIVPQERPPANLVLLVDVSGSMAPDDRLPLLQRVFRALAGELRPVDRVAVVTYANQVHTVLPPTPGDRREEIAAAIDGLRATGGTAGGDGIQRAYALAEQHFDPRAVNRIILATDGDFNVGITDPATLKQFVAEKRRKGIYLSVFGVGLGNLNDALMQTLAHAGNGNAAYIDSALEARKVLGSELGATVFPVADDAKIQVEFNPAQVAEYRLIGYESRLLRRQDFNDDRVDAGDIGSGHSVTAIYEITPAGGKGALTDPLRYQASPAAPVARTDEIAFVRLRYKLPGASGSRLMERPVTRADIRPTLEAVPADVRFAVAAAGFGQLLRGDPHVTGFGFADVVALAEPARGRDPLGHRAELVQLARAAGGLRP